MKIFQTIFICSFFFLGSFTASAQRDVVEDTIIVEGVCGMCKERIEEAAYGKGVKFVQWDKATSKLAIAFRSDKTSLEEIEQRVAKAGHSTEHVQAQRSDYEALPECCRYEHLEKH